MSFVDGSDGVTLDATYPIYVFKFINIHPSAHIEFAFNASIDSGSNYNVAKTTTTTSAFHGENDAAGPTYYYIDEDLAQGTGVARISGNIYTDNDSSMSGQMYLFNPSSTTFVKTFYHKYSKNGLFKCRIYKSMVICWVYEYDFCC